MWSHALVDIMACDTSCCIAPDFQRYAHQRSICIFHSGHCRISRCPQRSRHLASGCIQLVPYAIDLFRNACHCRAHRDFARSHQCHRTSLHWILRRIGVIPGYTPHHCSFIALTGTDDCTDCRCLRDTHLPSLAHANV